ncbi:MAG: 2-amino-4-hydroxy-6-hydroxymethyldihydropteridine diphosphokinase [Haliea sp.]|nr:MAG: 2-amino-4-hydroxy-6-hydroxymethyldihydropteridine diphosphokinase [Haliea sp.]
MPALETGCSRRAAVTAYVALGANLGDACAALAGAVLRLAAAPATVLTGCSSLYRTAPLSSGGADRPASGPVTVLGPDYLNAVVRLQTGLTAPALLDFLQTTEQLAGRERPYPDAPRTLDLDLLCYGDARIDSPRLTVPHPRMAMRAFVLVPLAEIAPDRVSSAQLEAVSEQSIERLGQSGE